VTNTQTFWEKLAESRWGQYVTKIEERIINHGSALAAPPSEALEIGCEGGRWSKMLADAGWKMTCIDVNPQTLSVCKERIPNANCVLVRPEEKAITQPSGKFSLLLCIEVAPVIDSDWFLPEAARVLKTGGIMVAVAWNRFSIRGVASRMQCAIKGDKNGEFYTRDYRTWRNALLKCGFEILAEEGLCWGPLGRMSNSPLVGFFASAERSLGLYRMPSVSPWIAVIARKK